MSVSHDVDQEVEQFRPRSATSLFSAARFTYIRLSWLPDNYQNNHKAAHYKSSYHGSLQGHPFFRPLPVALYLWPGLHGGRAVQRRFYLGPAPQHNNPWAV